MVELVIHISVQVVKLAIQWFFLLYVEIIYFSLSELSPVHVSNHDKTSHTHFSAGCLNNLYNGLASCTWK